MASSKGNDVSTPGIYVLCPGRAQFCLTTGAVRRPGSCCPSGNLVCTGKCKDRFLVSSPFSSLTHKSSFAQKCQRDRLLQERWVLPSWSSERVHSANDSAISDSVFHRSASLRLMSKHNSGSPLNLNPPRKRESCICEVPWRDHLLPC